MMTVIVSFAALVGLAVGAFVLVAVRNRRRLSSPDDSAAARDARAGQERWAAERHGVQGQVVRGNEAQGM